jgi:hypothetical protein
VAELIEPHLLLWLGPHAPYLEAPSAGNTVLRLYADTRPHVGKISGLQKGLVWVEQGRTVVEEGYGFGCPIVVWDGSAYLSRHATIERTTHGEVTRLIKRFEIDTVDTPIRILQRKYKPVDSLGAVEVRYDVHSDGQIDIAVDLTGLRVIWSQVYLMNEQGARRFTRYWDSDGRQLDAADLGIWESSGTFIAHACFQDEQDDLAFCVEPEPPVVVYYGRERYNQYNWRGIYVLSWSGVDLELTPPQTLYRYRILLEAQ